MQQQIKTAGDLRGFLADIMVGIKDGTVECAQASAISKVAAQINQSLATEVNTALALERMGKDRPIAGSMLIGNSSSVNPAALPVPDDEVRPIRTDAEPDADGMVWCDQCDGRVSLDDAAGCKSRHCSLKVAA